MRVAARSGALLAAALALVSLVMAARIALAGEAEASSDALAPIPLVPLDPVDTNAVPEPDLIEVRPLTATVTQTIDRVEMEPEPVEPLRVRIPGIGVDASVVDLGLRRNGTLQVPRDFSTTGWYTGRAAPGEPGPSVVVGHFDSKEGPAVFYRLRDLDPGDLIQIDRSDGTVAIFRVTDSVRVDKDEFPTDDVYGATAEATLRLVTCSGRFDHDEETYPGNLVVFAEHLGNQPTHGSTT